MFRKVNLQSLNNFKKKNTEKQPTNSISEQRISVIPIQSNSGPKIHDIPKFKTQKTTRIFHSSQSKRNFSVKNLFTNDKTEDGKLIYEDFYINNFKKKPSLFNVKSRKFLPFEQESVNISGIDNNTKEDNNNNSLNELVEIMEKSQKTRKKCSELENSDKITLSSYQNSKDIGEKKKQFSQPIIFDNENLERLNTNKYIDLKMIRKNFFSRENSKPVFQRASTSHQLFRFLPQKNDFAYKFNEEKTLKNRNYMIRPPTTSSNFYPGFNNFISDSNFVNSNREKISPKYNDSHLKYK